jgi:hypothetical protein
MIRVSHRVLALSILTLVLAASLAGGVYAACSNPTANAGDMIYSADWRVIQYCDGARWAAGGKPQYIANGVTFDGTNDFLTRGGDLTGNVDSKKATVSLWFRRNSFVNHHSFYNLNNRWSLYINGTTDRILINGRNASNVSILNLNTNATFTDSGWHHLLLTFDLSDPAKRHLYIDGASDLQVSTYTDDLIEFTQTTHAVGDKFDGDIADLWIDIDTYIDLSVAANREKFIKSGKPVYLGVDGSAPTGVKPEVFLSGATSTWHTNDGAGGGFTLNGALTDAVLDAGECAPYSEGKFTASDTANGDLLGDRDIDIDGNIAIVGAHGDDGIGAAYLFDVSNPANPVQLAKLTPSDGVAGDSFGHGVGISGDIAVVGGRAGNRAYIFDISTPASPVERAIFTGSDTAAGDDFGEDVEIEGNIVVVGAATWEGASGTNRGAAYVFDISNPASPVEKAIITPSNAADNDAFSKRSLAMEGNLLVAGAPNKGIGGVGVSVGRVYLFDLSDPANPVEESIVAATPEDAGANFGSRVALSGNLMVASAPFRNNIGSNPDGSAFVFDIADPANPVQKAHITSSDLADYDEFGLKVAISGSTAVITASGEDGAGGAGADRGAAYVFDLSDPVNPVEVKKITASDAQNDDTFGRTVAMTGNVVVIGTGSEDGAGLNRGAAYVHNLVCQCDNPVANEGSLIYNGDDNVLQFCNGEDWVAMGPVPGGGGAGCANPSGAKGDIRFNDASKAMQYCDGTDWVSFGGGKMDVTAGLVAHWKLDESSGTSAADSFGNNDGTLQNNPAWLPTGGKANGGLSFDSTNYVSVPSSASLSIGGSAISFGAWYYHTAPVDGFIMGKIVSDFTYALSVEQGSEQFLIRLKTSGGDNLLYFPASVTNGLDGYIGTWIHFFATYDGTTLRGYINGVELANMSATGNINSNSDDFAIGARGGDGSWLRFNSIIDDVRVYDRALSAAEVYTLYRATGGQ